MQANSVEVIGTVDLVDLPGAVVPNARDHERIRASRLADVMIVLERDAAEIAQAIGVRLAARWPGLREADVDLTIAEDAPIVTARASAEADPGADPIDPAALEGALAEEIETRIPEVIQRRAAVNRRFMPRITIRAEQAPSSAEELGVTPAARTAPEQPMRSVAIQSAAVLHANPVSRFWLVVLFALIAAVFLGTGYLIVMQPR